MPAPMAALVVVGEKKMPDCSLDVAKTCLSTFIKRSIVDKSNSVDEVMEAWNGRLLGPWELASKILVHWEAVRTYARTHSSLTVLSEVERPFGRTLGRILSFRDSRETEHILHVIVGIPLEIVTQMRALYATASPAGTASSRKRGRGEASMPSIRAEDPCASDAGASLGCVARCGSCAQGCGCTEWDKTNHTKVDDVKTCYICYAQLCAEKATPKFVEHISNGKPIALSTVATGRLATKEARGLCDSAMAAMRTLSKRRSDKLQYAVMGGRAQFPRPRAAMWRNWSPHEKKKYYEWALKNLPNPPAASTERPNMEVYSTYVEASHKLASLREDTERRGLCIFFGDDGVEQRTPVDSVGGESLHAGMDADKQRMHNDLPPPGTAQSLMHLTPARSSTMLYRFHLVPAGRLV